MTLNLFDGIEMLKVILEGNEIGIPKCFEAATILSSA